MDNNCNSNEYDTDDISSSTDSSLITIQKHSQQTGVLGIDPFIFIQFGALCLTLWRAYLFIPPGF